jgi:hypothetical protein
MVAASHASLSDTSRQGGDRAPAGAQRPGAAHDVDRRSP